MVKLVDTLDLGSSASRLGGSSPFTRTKKDEKDIWARSLSRTERSEDSGSPFTRTKFEHRHTELVEVWLCFFSKN